MELRNLKYFVVVAKEMSFRRASDRLHGAQSAVSRRIQDLEVELGVQLFEREGKRITLSAAGRVFAQESRRILDELTQASDRVRLIARGTEGTLRIGLHPSAAQHAVVPASFRAFRTAFQVRGTAGERQVAGVKLAIAHGNGGVLSSQATAIFGSAEVL
jgi:DNA-binding transcriptional LysR family regulator